MKDYLTMVRVIDCYFEFEPKYWVEGLITKAIVVCVFNPYDLEQFDLCRYRWRLTCSLCDLAKVLLFSLRTP